MKKANSSAGGISIQDLMYEILIQIFLNLNVVDLVVVSMVCKQWNEICRSPVLWAKFDLSRLSSNAFDIPSQPRAWSDDKISRNRLGKFMKYALSLSNYNTSCVVFNFFLYLTDAHFIFVAKRTPNLRRLVLPYKGRLSMDAIENAMKYSWSGLESITITGMLKPMRIFAAIGKYCPNISEMKLTDKLDIGEANLIVKYTPNLKLLSVRNILVNLKALSYILNNLKMLEAVNIYHSYIWEDKVKGKPVYVEPCVIQNRLSFSSFQKLLLCNEERCRTCRIERNSHPKKKPYVYFEYVWREDEIKSLAH